MSELYNAAVRAVPMSARIARLPVSPKGYPTPWFVAQVGDGRDFRVVDTAKHARAMRARVCWVCGEPLGKRVAMTIGPMCSINRVISEPASHRECAVFSALACPFLANPEMRRNDRPIGIATVDAADLPIARNPGAVAVWITDTYWPIRVDNGTLYRFGEPSEVLWFARGRSATRGEVEDSIASGLPILRDHAQVEGRAAMADLERRVTIATRYLPPAGEVTGEQAVGAA